MNFLITGAWSQAKEFTDWFNKKGHNVVFMQHEKDELPCDYLWVEGIIGNGIFLSHNIDKFKNLKYIQLTSVGYDRVPMSYVKLHNITINNAKGVYSIPMAEYAITGVMYLYKQMSSFEENRKNKCWKKNRVLSELFDKTVCIVGCGNVGTECAKRFSAFGCRIVGVDLFPQENDFYDRIVPISKLNEELSNSDILVLTVPLTKETSHLMNQYRLRLLKREAIVVNISRGGVIDTSALVRILPHIGGAVLDVFENEPLEIDNKLWEMDRVVITPHNSFVGEGNNSRLNNVIIKNLVDNHLA